MGHTCCICRMLWSFSRDGAVPGWRLWSSVNPVTKTPVNAVLFMVRSYLVCVHLPSWCLQ